MNPQTMRADEICEDDIDSVIRFETDEPGTATIRLLGFATKPTRVRLYTNVALSQYGIPSVPKTYVDVPSNTNIIVYRH